MAVNKHEMARFDDFIGDVKGRAKRIFFKLDQTQSQEPPTVVGKQLLQSAPIYRAAIILTATDDTNEKGDKNFWYHVWRVATMEIANEDARKKWDEARAADLSKLKSEIQALAPGLGIVEGQVGVA